MRVTIDREGCIECGVCEATCPDIFELKDNEKARIVPGCRVDGQPAVGEVSDDQAACAKTAESSCPVSVIKAD